LAPPRAAEAIEAAALWGGPVESVEEAAPAPVLIDALFGIGLAKPLDPALVATVARLGAAARLRIAVDLPSGVATDSGALLPAALACDLTVTFGALKPAHLLQPAAALCGRTVVAEIGLAPAAPTLFATAAPALAAPAADAHKFSRGHVLVVGGPVRSTGAARLAARAAQRAGAGYVTLACPPGALATYAAQLDETVLKPAASPDELAALAGDPRVSALVVGPGLARLDARDAVMAVLTSGKPAVLDADVFTAFAGDPDGLAAAIRGPAVLTPHEGEFARLLGNLPGSRIDRARAAAARIGAVVLLKGPDTVIAAPDGRAAINAHATPWLATAGSGDVLTGIIAARLATGVPPFEAAAQGAWLHGEAGLRAGSGLVASDLIAALPAVVAARA
ncbi:MAG: NAD(P)H-hydrate dehydratase, partial [Alphaproteobacteria bacterium]|nr:NAD(P)H-hydrate dehydratase [Alphaproteobacteria bacterium]